MRHFTLDILYFLYYDATNQLMSDIKSNPSARNNSTKLRSRTESILAYAKAGYTLQAIGGIFNLTRERVRQIIRAEGLVIGDLRPLKPIIFPIKRV